MENLDISRESNGVKELEARELEQVSGGQETIVSGKMNRPPFIDDSGSEDNPIPSAPVRIFLSTKSPP